MFTTAPEITNDAIVGQVVVAATATPSPASATPSPTSTPVYTFPTSIAATKKYKTNSLSIYGYGPSNSLVTLRGFGVSERTISDDKGYFVFSSIYSFSKTYPELCLQSTDNQNRTTQPTCIPALPNDSLVPLEVGPVLLSPTLSLSGNRIIKDKDGYLSGKTTPNTLVNIFLAKAKEGSLGEISFIQEANAYSLPVLNTTSNEKGEFDINMPTSDIATYKVFASTKYFENLSAKSNTLKFSVISSSKSFWQMLIEFLLQNKIIAFIVLEVVIFVTLFVKALNQTTKPHRRHF